MSSEVQSTDALQGEKRQRRKLSKASRSHRRKSSQRPTPSPRASKSVSVREEEGVSSEKVDNTADRVEITALNRTLMTLLDEIKEDVVAKEQVNRITSKRSRFEVESVKSSDSSDVHQMFVQTISGFKPTSDPPNKSTDALHKEPEGEENCFARCIQRVWMILSTMCHGFLGGASVTHLTLIWTIDPGEWPLELIKKYASFVEVFGNTFYFLATVCMVSVLDRMDLACFKVNKTRAITWLIILVIYAATLLMSLTCDSFDTRLYRLDGFNVTIDEDEIRVRKLFSVWNSLSVGRSVGGILGWIALGSVASDKYYY